MTSPLARTSVQTAPGAADQDPALAVCTGVRGGDEPPHVGAGLRVRTGVRAGGNWGDNHSEPALRVRTGVRAGGYESNHSQGVLAVRTGVPAGGFQSNHSENVLRA